MEAVPTNIHSSWNSALRVGLSFMERTIAYFEEKVATFAKHIRNGSLVFIPHLSAVSIQNEALIEEMRALNPYVVHWSNVVDYLPPAEFHAVAKKISGSETIHYLHSCNWTTRVYGTDIHDIKEDMRIYFYAGGLKGTRLMHSVIEGICDFSPLHYRTICATILGRKFVDQFFQYLFKGEEVNCACFNGNTPLKQLHPFTRSVTTAFVTFAYTSSGVTFGSDAYEFEQTG